MATYHTKNIYAKYLCMLVPVALLLIMFLLIFVIILAFLSA